MRATSTYRVCKETCWINQNYPSGAGKSAELIDDKSPYYKYTPAIGLENKISSCTGIATCLRTKQYLLIDLT